MTDYRLDWRGDDVRREAVNAIYGAVLELGGRWEAAAKGSVRPGRGVLTGTYRRSLHYARPDYDFASDDVPPSPGSPERSGHGGGPEVRGDKISILLGSGLNYARKLEALYGVVVGAFDQVRGQFLDILERHAKKRGLA